MPAEHNPPATPNSAIWRVRAVAVRVHAHGLRWTLEAATDDLETLVTADTSYDGLVRDLQSGSYVGTTGDDDLDWLVVQHIRDVLGLRSVLQALDAIDRQRFGRIQQPRDRDRWAA